MGRPDFNSGEMRNACLVGSTPMSFRHHWLPLKHDAIVDKNMKTSLKLVVLHAFLFSLFSLSVQADETRISLAVGPGGITGSYFAVGGSICQQVNQAGQGQEVTCHTNKASSSTEAIQSLGTMYDFALVMSAAEFDAFNGLNEFDQIPFEDLRFVFSLTFENGVLLSLVSLESMPDAFVYQLVAAIFDDFEAFKSRHPALARQNVIAMSKSGQSAPLHPGALKYFTEKAWY